MVAAKTNGKRRLIPRIFSTFFDPYPLWVASVICKSSRFYKGWNFRLKKKGSNPGY
jgi:hypothetical protein